MAAAITFISGALHFLLLSWGQLLLEPYTYKKHTLCRLDKCGYCQYFY
jgi:hypothetical protein